MTIRFADHFLGPDAHANRPAATAVPVGTRYVCTTHALIYKSDGTAWSTWAAVVPTGGTAGQALLKNSGTDYDVAWGTVSSGGGGGVSGFTQLRKSADQTINSNTWTAISWNTEDYDTLNAHESVTNPSRFTAPSAGIYQITTSIALGSAGTNDKYLSYYVNGVQQLGWQMVPGGVTSPLMTLSRHLVLATSDYVEAYVYQNTGAAQTLFANMTGHPGGSILTAVKLGTV